MQLRRNDELEHQFQDGLSSISAGRPSGGPLGVRSVGPHVSGIIVDIATQMNILRRPTPADAAIAQPDGADNGFNNLMAMGFIWEDIIGGRLAELQGVQPGQFECVLDGIIGTPDRYRPGMGEIDEFKATWLSTSNDIMGDKCWRWWAQVKAYCHMVGCYNANLWVFHINGDYRPPRPEPRVYSALFTPDDLKRNWMLITNHNKSMIKAKGEWWLRSNNQP